MPNLLDKEKHVFDYENLKLFKDTIEAKNILRVLEFNQSQCFKSYLEFNTYKKLKPEKNGDKNKRDLYKLIENVFFLS